MLGFPQLIKVGSQTIGKFHLSIHCAMCVFWHIYGANAIKYSDRVEKQNKTRTHLLPESSKVPREFLAQRRSGQQSPAPAAERSLFCELAGQNKSAAVAFN